MSVVDVTLWHGEDQVVSLLLPAAPQIGHRIVLMDMDIRLGAQAEVVDWTVTEAIWGCYPQLPKSLGADSLRTLDLQVIPTKEAKEATS